MRLSSRAVAGIAGISAAFGVAVVYAMSGYRPAMLLLLAGAILAIAFFLSRQPFSLAPFVLSDDDLRAIAILLVLMVPLYFWRLYSIPWQVNTDEVTIMQMSRGMVTTRTDFLGISAVFGFPSASFVFVGRTAQMLGGIGLYNSRFVHAALGIVCVLVAYGFFRQLMAWQRALSFAILLGANHALFAISRMAMRENTSLLFEGLTLMFLARGMRRRSPASIFLAGVSAGLGFYGYFPGRIAVVIGVGVLVAAVLISMSTEVMKVAARFAAIFVFGWVVAAAPVVIASRANTAQAFGYARQQFLIYPEGRQLQQTWTGQKTGAEAWKANIRNGLAMFNSKEHDQGYIYPNYGHAFVDPVTSILLWIGLAIAAVRLARHRRKVLSGDDRSHVYLGDLIAIVGFLTIYLSSAFLITKAPNYTRLLVILPFVSYLAGTAIWAIAGVLLNRPYRNSPVTRRRASILAYASVAVITLWNVSMFTDFVHIGTTQGNDVGSTARYIDTRKAVPGYTWLVVADSAHPYYSWGGPWQWKDWAGFFQGPSQTTEVKSVAQLDSLSVHGNFTIFIANRFWQASESAFRARHPLYEVKWLTPDSRLLAIDVRDTQ